MCPNFIQVLLISGFAQNDDPEVGRQLIAAEKAGSWSGRLAWQGSGANSADLEVHVVRPELPQLG